MNLNYFLILLFLFFFYSGTFGQTNDLVIAEKETNKDVVFVILAELSQISTIDEWMKELVTTLSSHFDKSFYYSIYGFNLENADESFKNLCSYSLKGVSIILDLTVGGLRTISAICKTFDFPYIRIQVNNFPIQEAALEYIGKKFGKDLAVVFQNEYEADMGLFNLIAYSTLRIIVLDQLTNQSLERMKKLRPQPSFYLITANTVNINRLFEMAYKGGLVTRMDRWVLMFEDFQTEKFQYNWNNFPAIAKLKIDPKFCCDWLTLKEECQCPEDFNFLKIYFNSVITQITETIKKMEYPILSYKCYTPTYANSTLSKEIISDFQYTKLYRFSEKDSIIKYNVNVSIYANQENSPNSTFIGSYIDGDIYTEPGYEIKSAKRFLRIGTIEMIPWAYYKRDLETNELILNQNGEPIWEGYCIDLMAKLAEKMEFDYEIVSPKVGRFGNKTSGKWNGLIGDLIMGEIDITVAPLKMTAEREEVIDFIAPYFEQTGISIIMRKPVRQTSLFKFMTVLRLEVWLSILGALIATAIMVWLLDKYSPYSARNNRDAYPYPCRDFTLKESFWFALTSFTPQGGGEAPKAISGRTLVAAYWLFVVLMLATFTANLAAFLTVERMQTPVQSLEQLSRQSRINYTVVNQSDTYQYFNNMEKAENTLYRMWKEETLNSTNDKEEFRVWDYPIKEQYGHIFTSIKQSGLLQNASEGFKKVNDLVNADFAFIHDSAEIKYEVSRNCNFTEVGEVFAEQPYALAVQQGSHLQDELSRTVLALQKDRYFETLTAKYWNNSVRGICDTADDSEGITLESLGGVFIATLFGLAIAMVTLVGEVFYQRKKEAEGKILPVVPINKINPNNDLLKKVLKGKPSNEITFGKTFVPATEKKQRVSYISIFPRNSIHQRNHITIN